LSSTSLAFIALRHLDNLTDADDALQDAFLSAYERLAGTDGDRAGEDLDQFSADIDHRAGVLKKSDQQPDPEKICLTEEFGALLARLTAHFIADFAQCFRLREVEGLTIRETALALGCQTARLRHEFQGFERSSDVCCKEVSLRSVLDLMFSLRSSK
jgi:DNA-directed RNA polymerase specialized sigma24 family protein